VCSLRTAIKDGPSVRQWQALEPRWADRAVTSPAMALDPDVPLKVLRRRARSSRARRPRRSSVGKVLSRQSRPGGDNRDIIQRRASTCEDNLWPGTSGASSEVGASTKRVCARAACWTGRASHRSLFTNLETTLEHALMLSATFTDVMAAQGESVQRGEGEDSVPRP
jgi:hypothetical protein